MSDNRLPEYLDQMRQAGSDAKTFVDGLNKEDFVALVMAMFIEFVQFE
jgi:hypothetical protein